MNKMKFKNKKKQLIMLLVNKILLNNLQILKIFKNLKYYANLIIILF